MDIDNIFSAFTYKPSNPFTIEKTGQSQSRQPLPTPVPFPDNASSWKRRGQRREPVVVSRYFLRSHDSSSLVTDSKASSTATTDGEKPVVVSRYFLPSHASCSTATTDGGKPVVVSRYFLPSHAASSVLTDAPRLQELNAKASGADGKKPNLKAKKLKVPYFSAAQKKSEAYRRVADNNTWDPPASCYHLLQERHSSDPWRVLIICMLLNVTTGNQVGSVLSSLFLLCPNAEAMSKVDEEEVEKVIHSLGLQKRRSKMLKRFSCEYLRDDWIYITQLHGIGKYAADAYAIFCTGKMKQIIPRDHKLVAYWKFVCGEEFNFES